MVGRERRKVNTLYISPAEKFDLDFHNYFLLATNLDLPYEMLELSRILINIDLVVM